MRIVEPQDKEKLLHKRKLTDKELQSKVSKYWKDAAKAADEKRIVTSITNKP